MAADWGLLQPYWLLALPLSWLWARWRNRRGDEWPALQSPLAIRFPPLGHVAGQPVDSTRSGRSRYATWLAAAALALLLVALAQPVQYTRAVAEQAKSEPVDLVLVIDTGISMGLRDYRIKGQAVDRMTLVRRFVDRFVARYSGRRIGLVILGNPPALWLPLTSDRRVVRDAVSRIHTVLGGRLNDAGATLKLVQQHFDTPGEKVVVMVSDGSLLLGAVSPQQAAAELGSRGFSLYVIAMGAGEEGAGVSEQAGLLYQPANLKPLRQMAKAGHGAFFHAQNAQAFGDALHTIESRHRRLVEQSPEQRLRTAWYPFPLGLAMLLLALSFGGVPRPLTFGSRGAP